MGGHDCRQCAPEIRYASGHVASADSTAAASPKESPQSVWLPLDPQESAVASVVLSVGSMLWGLASRTGQQLVAAAHERSSNLRRSSGEGNRNVILQGAE